MRKPYASDISREKFEEILPHAIAVTTAEVTDRKGALQAMQRCKGSLDTVCRRQRQIDLGAEIR